MKILIAGLGSVGQRHAKNLRALGHELLAYRVRGQAPRAGWLEVPAYQDLEQALDQKPDAVFITNPTSLHLPVALAAARRGCHLFIEKPLSHTLEGVAELKAEAQRRRLTVMVGCQLRFHPLLRQARELIASGAIGRVITARLHAGEYLPDWHPWEDYRQGYSAKQDLGGGVILTLIHELDYAYWLFGEVDRVTAVAARRSALEIDVEDTADIVLETAAGASVNVHLDYVTRPPSRGMSVAGESGKLEWDFHGGALRWRTPDASAWQTVHLPVERNEMFVAETRHFFDCIERGSEPLIPLSEGERVLEIALAAKMAAETGQSVRTAARVTAT